MDPLSLLSAGSSIVGGIAGLFGSNKAEKRAQQAASEALALQREGLGFAMQQYKDWQSTYGQIEKQLSDYYVSSNGQMQRDVAAGMVETAFRNVPMQIERTAAQRGLGEGQTAAMLSDALVAKAEQKAGARIGADAQFRQEKQGFLNSGQNSRSQASAGVMNSYNTMTSLLNSQASQYQQQALAGGTAAGSAISQGLSAFMALNGAGGNGLNTGSASTLDYDMNRIIAANPEIFG